MSDEFLGDRKKALEEGFFAKENAKLVERMRSEQQHKAAAEALASVSGIDDSVLLARLTDLDIGPETWVALSLVPLVEVAWADNVVEAKERRAVLTAAESNGIFPGSPSHALLETWLNQRPEPELLQAWGEYIVDLCAKLTTGEKEALRRDILGRARSVAQAAGGILGLGNKVSEEEEVVLRQLAKAFEG